MSRLTSVDSKRLSVVLLEIHGAKGVVDFRSRTLKVMRGQFGSELCGHNGIDLANGDSLSALSESTEEFAALRPRFFDHVEQHWSIQHYLLAEGRDTQAVKTSDSVGQRRLRSTGRYSEFYRSLADVRYQLSIGQRLEDWLVFSATSRDSETSPSKNGRF